MNRDFAMASAIRAQISAIPPIYKWVLEANPQRGKHKPGGHKMQIEKKL
jgi:hypothetical protein